MKRAGTTFWIIVAASIALFLGTQQIQIAVAVTVITTLILLAIFTPLAALVVVLVFAPLRTLIATEATLQLPLDIGQLSLIGLLGAWAVYRITRRQPVFKLSWSPVYVPLIVFLLGILPGAFLAASIGAWLNEWLKWLQILVLVVFCLMMIKGRNWHWIVFGLVSAGIANAIVGIYEYFGGSGALHLLINGRYFRAFGTFGQPNPFGGFMGLIAPLSLMMVVGSAWRLWANWRDGRSVDRNALLKLIFYGFASGLMTMALFMSWSRGAWLGFGGAVAVMVVALPQKLWHGLAVIALGAGLAGILLLSGRLPQSIVDRFTSGEEYSFLDDMRGVDITSENYAVVERLAHWQAALNMAQDNPYFGVGMGNYEVVYAQYRLMNWVFPLGHAHNYYLNILAEAGIIGLSAYLLLWLSIGWMTWQIRQHPDMIARCAGIGLLGTWTYLTIHSLTDNLYVNNLFLHIGVMMGMLAVLYRQTHYHVAIGSE